MVGSAIAVVAGGLLWWFTFGPGSTNGTAWFSAAEREKKPREPAQQATTAPAPAGSTPPVTDGSDLKGFQGVWRGTIPRTVIAKSYDAPLTITYNDQGEGFPKFETPPEDAAEFKAAGFATILQRGGKNKVTLLRDWEIILSPDQQTMTWTEVNGPAKVKFKKQ